MSALHDVTLTVDRVSVGSETVEVVMRTLDSNGAVLRAGPEVAERALALLPGLAEHMCSNDAGRVFVDELTRTEAAHLLEHVTLELMAAAGSSHELSGVTSWDFTADGPGVFHVVLEYDDDLVCLGAIKAAYSVLGYLFKEEAYPDVSLLVKQLAMLRSTPAQGQVTAQGKNCPAFDLA